MSAKDRVRRRVWMAGGKRCWLCGEPVSLADVTMDHVVPKSKGGRDSAVNYRAAHKDCNEKRRNADPPIGAIHPMARKGAFKAVAFKNWKRPKRHQVATGAHPNEHRWHTSDALALRIERQVNHGNK